MMLEFKNVSFRYAVDEFPMMENLSFSVEEGDFVSIIGASGCGKSTIFRLINGLEQLQKGEILVNGKPIREQKQYSAFMPQKDLLFPWRTIEKNICLPMELAGVPAAEQAKRCRDVLTQVGLLEYMKKFGFAEKTGIDLAGEATGIIHKAENVGPVELATMSFGQSFQITPIQMAVTVSSMVNGGRRVTPHLGVSVLDKKGKTVKTFKYGEKEGIVSEKTSETMQELLEKVVSEGSGKNAYLEGYSIGGKTATSQTLPRSAGKYISSFIGFAPADDPQILGMVIIHDPQGIYYGGTIAAPVLRDIYDNVLPYLGIEKK